MFALAAAADNAGKFQQVAQPDVVVAELELADFQWFSDLWQIIAFETGMILEPAIGNHAVAPGSKFSYSPLHSREHTMPLPLFISGILLLQLAGCAMGREAQSTESVPPPVAVATERQAVPAAEPVVAPPPAEEPSPAVVAPAPAVAPSVVPETTSAPPPATPAIKPVPVIADKPVAKPPAKTAAPAPQQKPVAKPQAAPAMALTTLEQRLKDTNAIGLFTKIALKNQVDDLVNRVRAHHEGNGATLAQLRQTYDQLLAKVHGLLKDGDPALAGSIMASREAIWQVLTDPVKFAKL